MTGRALCRFARIVTWHWSPTGGDRRGLTTTGLEVDDICDSRKSVSNHVYPATGPDPPMFEVERVACAMLRGCPLIGRLLLRGW